MVYIPANRVFLITLNGKAVWQNKSFVRNKSIISSYTEKNDVVFEVPAGQWTFKASRYNSHQSSDLLNANVVCDGNSLTYGKAGNADGKTFPVLLEESSLAKDFNLKVINKGINAQTTPQMSADYDTDISPMKNKQVTNILIAWECTNDLYFGANVQQAYDHFVSYCKKARMDGWKVVVMNTLPRGQLKNDGTPIVRYNAELDSVNSLIAANWQDFADAYADLRKDKRLTDYNDTTYFAKDKIHLVEKGYQVVAEKLKIAIQEL